MLRLIQREAPPTELVQEVEDLDQLFDLFLKKLGGRDMPICQASAEIGIYVYVG